MESAPMLVVPWGDLADRVMALMKASEGVLVALVQAPRRSFHAYAIWLRANPELDAATAARRLETTAPEVLLAQALGGEETGDLWRMLGKLQADEALAAERYAQLHALCRSSILPLLERATIITPSKLDLYDEVLRLAAEEPLIAAVGHVFERGMGSLNHVHAALRFLRAHQLLDARTERHQRSLAACTSQKQVYRWITRMLHRLELPRLDIPDGSPFHMPATISEMRRIAYRFNNPVVWNTAQCFVALQQRSAALVWTRGAETALIYLDVATTRSGLCIVHLKHLRDRRNAEIEGELRQRILADLRQVPGLEMSTVAPHGLSILMRRGDVRHPPFADDDALEGMIMPDEAELFDDGDAGLDHDAIASLLAG